MEVIRRMPLISKIWLILSGVIGTVSTILDYIFLSQDFYDPRLKNAALLTISTHICLMFLVFFVIKRGVGDNIG